ncbi:hypothetical protein EWM64_g1336 [Hericium alpestre]|uniref:Integrase catalytic domain-containing protein n=1 Tax=Hericium alpestre TaxID=135208 RepID=A0A4Z0A6L6_9AGAM|nr:hypothetical protein EWM64_g1336 [Hericium alpestre]
MPKTKGKYHVVGIFLDTFSQHVWAWRFNVTASAKTTISCLQNIFQGFIPPETFMTDGGSHFKNAEVRAFCEKWSCKHQLVASYSPWVNGLVEGTNKLLIHVLARLAAPGLGEDDYVAKKPEDLPNHWPEHLDEAVRILNNRLLPALKFTPKELLFGVPVNTPPSTVAEVASVLRPRNVNTHMAYVAQQRIDGYEAMVTHAIRRKSAFDKNLKQRLPGEVLFHVGQLVQVYRNDLDFTFRSAQKLLAKWSPPGRITSQARNSYVVVTLEGVPVKGSPISARRLRAFTPRPGSALERDQKAYEEQLQEEARQEAARQLEVEEGSMEGGGAGEEGAEV